MSNWLLVGPVEHWRIALDAHCWGFRDVATLRSLVTKIKDGDTLFFYVKIPVSGVVGLGKVHGSVFKADKPLWPDEIAAGVVIYNYRFNLETVRILDHDTWSKRAIRLVDLDLSLKIYSAVNPIPVAAASALEREAYKWEKPVKLVEENHDSIKNMIHQIGILQGWISEMEWPLESFRLDVVWKRVNRGNPHVAFEVQIGGNLIEALTKLKHAFDIWNSTPILVTNENHLEKAGELVEGSFHEIKDTLRIMDWRKIYDLLESKKNVKALELELGIPVVRPTSRAPLDTVR